MKKRTQRKQDNTIPILTHVLGLVTGFIAPLVTLLATKDKYVKKHAKTALNWQFSLVIYMIVAGILTLIFIGFVILPILGVLNIVFCVIATIRASENELWKYPISIPFFKLKK